MKVVNHHAHNVDMRTRDDISGFAGGHAFDFVSVDEGTGNAAMGNRI